MHILSHLKKYSVQFRYTRICIPSSMSRVVCGAQLRLLAPWVTRLLSQWMLHWWQVSGKIIIWHVYIVFYNDFLGFSRCLKYLTVLKSAFSDALRVRIWIKLRGIGGFSFITMRVYFLNMHVINQVVLLNARFQTGRHVSFEFAFSNIGHVDSLACYKFPELEQAKGNAAHECDGKYGSNA